LVRQSGSPVGDGEKQTKKGGAVLIEIATDHRLTDPEKPPSKVNASAARCAANEARIL